MDASLSPADLFQWELARAVVRSFRPEDNRGRSERERILAYMDEHPDALVRSCLQGHLTASGLILDTGAERALLTHHKKLDRWLQLGGHVDGSGDLSGSALREGVEESGIPDLTVDAQPVDLDIHTIPPRGDEPQHLHLDVRFLLHAPAGCKEIVSDESHDLAWVAPSELADYATDDSVVRLFRLAFGAEALPASLRTVGTQ